MLLRACLTCPAPGRITRDDIELVLAESVPGRTGRSLLGRTLGEWQSELEREYLLELFFDLGGNVRSMCERLKVQRTTLYSWFRRLCLNLRDLRARL